MNAATEIRTGHRVTCNNGSCRQEYWWHHALWPALRLGVRTRGNSGTVGLPVRRPKRYYYSATKRARLLHRTKRSATVWRHGKLLIVGASGLCGSESCLAVMTSATEVPGLMSCPKCMAVAFRASGEVGNPK